MMMAMMTAFQISILVPIQNSELLPSVSLRIQMIILTQKYISLFIEIVREYGAIVEAVK
jgi:hypothetical protein